MTDRNSGPIADGRNPDGTFAPGNSGRPKGVRHRKTRIVEELLDGEAETLTRKAIEMALDGDMAALRLCVERIAPPRKDSPVSFEMPTVATAQDAASAPQAVLTAVAAGDLTPTEGASIMALVEGYRRAAETADLETRIEALEAKK